MLLLFVSSVCLLFSVSGQRIAGGDTAEIQKYPFAVSLLNNNGTGTSMASFSHACGGTILTNNVILSAASCFYTNLDAHPASWWRARVGSSYSNVGGSIYRISHITPNPDFSATTLDNDIALLRTTLTLALVLGSVEVARISGAAFTFGVHHPVRAIGWGATSNQDSSSSPELRDVQVWSIDQTTCSNRWNTVGVNVTNNMVCVGWLDVGVRGQCGGDAGSPLLDDAEGMVVGVFSRSYGCAQGWYPDVNTRIAPYLPWILTTAYQ